MKQPSVEQKLLIREAQLRVLRAEKVLHECLGLFNRLLQETIKELELDPKTMRFNVDKLEVVEVEANGG